MLNSLNCMYELSRNTFLCFLADDAMCPVKSLVKYKRHLNPKISSLFQRPKPIDNISKEDKVWYDAIPLGHNTIGSMMAKISEAAQLSKKYTNHSLRATAVHVLDAAHFPSRHIMSVTGHKAESSLKTYTGYTDSNTKRSMSEEISKSVRPEKENVPHTVTSASSYSEQAPDMAVVCAPACDSPSTVEHTDFPELDLRDFDFDLLENAGGSVNTTVVSNTETSTARSLAPVMNNCSNITINFNFQK